MWKTFRDWFFGPECVEGAPTERILSALYNHMQWLSDRELAQLMDALEVESVNRMAGRYQNSDDAELEMWMH